MKKIALIFLTLGIWLTSLGQGEQGWDINNKTTVSPAGELGILVQSPDGKEHIYLSSPSSAAGFPLPPDTNNTVYVCWATQPSLGNAFCQSNEFPITNICWSNTTNPPSSAVLTINGTCDVSLGGCPPFFMSVDFNPAACGPSGSSKK